jgi:aryl-alcohol dehydrogenase-like predicted oxidoreductase
MEYRPLGRTGVKVSQYCLGVMTFGGGTTNEEAFQILDSAIDAGINFIDTANAYQRGRSEEVLGEGLKLNGKRDRMVIATKVHGPMADDDPNMRGNSRRHIIEQCDASLRRLQTDWIDLYQIHGPMAGIPIDETLRALDDLVRAGKVRYIGTSNYSAWQMMESLWVSKDLGLNRFICTQPPYNLLDRRIERELVPMCLTYGVGIIPYSPIAGGMLTGKYRRNAPMPENSRFTITTSPRLKALVTNSIYDTIEGLEPIAREKGCTLGQLALAWMLRQPGITAPIIGPRTVEHYKENMGALDVQLTEDDLRRIDEIAPPGSNTAPYYETYEWGPHPYRALS